MTQSDACGKPRTAHSRIAAQLVETKTMIAPKYVRARLLEGAVRVACNQLQDPIEVVEMRGDHAVVRAGNMQAVVRFTHSASYDQNGLPVLGSDDWSPWIESVAPVPAVPSPEISPAPIPTWTGRLQNFLARFRR